MKKASIVKKGDVSVIFAILLTAVIISVCFFASRGDKLYAEVRLDNKILYSTSLGQGIKKSIPVDCKYGCTVIIDDDRVCVSDSGCNNHLCESTGYISKKGQTIVCVPNRLIIEIKSDKGSGVDVILK